MLATDATEIVQWDFSIPDHVCGMSRRRRSVTEVRTRPDFVIPGETLRWINGYSSDLSVLSFAIILVAAY
jgi:hypothetical protein